MRHKSSVSAEAASMLLGLSTSQLLKANPDVDTDGIGKYSGKHISKFFWFWIWGIASSLKGWRQRRQPSIFFLN